MGGRRRHTIAFVQVGVLTMLAGGAGIVGAVMAPVLAPAALRHAAAATLAASSFTADDQIHGNWVGGIGPAYSSHVALDLYGTLVYQAPDRAELTSSGGTPGITTGTNVIVFPETQMAIGSSLYQEVDGPSPDAGVTARPVQHQLDVAARMIEPVTTYLNDALSATEVQVSGSRYTFTERLGGADTSPLLRGLGPNTSVTVVESVSGGYIHTIDVTTKGASSAQTQRMVLSRIGTSPPVRLPVVQAGGSGVAVAVAVAE